MRRRRQCSTRPHATGNAILHGHRPMLRRESAQVLQKKAPVQPATRAAAANFKPRCAPPLREHLRCCGRPTGDARPTVSMSPAPPPSSTRPTGRGMRIRLPERGTPGFNCRGRQGCVTATDGFGGQGIFWFCVTHRGVAQATAGNAAKLRGAQRARAWACRGRGHLHGHAGAAHAGLESVTLRALLKP